MTGGAQRARRIALTTIALLALCAVPAQAFKVRTHLFIANQVIAPIVAGQNNVVIDGQTLPVPTNVAQAIREFPNHFRGGVVGPDAYPDIAAGQGTIHPEKHREWLKLVFDRARAEFNACNGCDKGQQALAFGYGFMLHPAGDMWAHTYVNAFAEGVFPAVADIPKSRNNLHHAVRHIVVEGYLDRHTPSSTLTLEAPVDFIHKVFVGSDKARQLGRGPIIEFFAGIRKKVSDRRKKNKKDLDKQNRACVGPVCGPDPRDAPLNLIENGKLRLENLYFDEWIKDIDSGLKEYVKLSRSIARELFGQEEPDIGDVRDAVERFVTRHGLSMIGLPDFVGGGLSRIKAAEDALKNFAKSFVPAKLRKLKDDAIELFLETPLGVKLSEFKEFVTKPELHINRTTEPVALKPGTSARIDADMGLTRDGLTNPPEFYNPEVFKPVRNAITLSKLALLEAPALNTMINQRGVAGSNHYTGTTNVMLGWPLSIDGQHQWRATSPRDGKAYGAGNFPLWEKCALRQPVFRTLFQDFENPTNFPDLGDPCSP